MDDFLERARSLVDGERDAVANAANLSALLIASLANVNWCGFYFLRGSELVLGPFAGKPAVTRIARGAGVCGAAWERGETVVVGDVHAFDGHIACDAASASEIVVPITNESGVVVAVLDVDSPQLERFGDAERVVLEALATIYASASDLDALAR